MSYYKINIDDVKHYITSFNNSEAFYDYFRNMINNVECMGILCQDKFFFEKYTTDRSIQFKNNLIINYMINNTSEFFDSINNYNNYADNNYYIYFSNYAMIIDNELNIYKIYLGKPDTFIITDSKYQLSLEPIKSNFNFKDSYTFDNIDELKNTVLDCLNNNNCADMFINDYCLFDATCSKKVNVINNMIVRNNIIDYVNDYIFNNVFVDTILINMYDKSCIYNCHTILITMNNNDINVFVSRTHYY